MRSSKDEWLLKWVFFMVIYFWYEVLLQFIFDWSPLYIDEFATLGQTIRLWKLLSYWMFELGVQTIKILQAGIHASLGVRWCAHVNKYAHWPRTKRCVDACLQVESKLRQFSNKAFQTMSSHSKISSNDCAFSILCSILAEWFFIVLELKEFMIKIIFILKSIRQTSGSDLKSLLVR